MNDIEVKHDATGELMVASASGQTIAGVEFVDAYMPVSGRPMQVVDVGVIIVSEEDLPEFCVLAREAGLEVEHT